jgi:hypothetical protein
VARGGLPALAELEIGDEPETWARAGFAVSDAGEARVGSVVLRMAGRERGDGILGWTLRARAPLAEQLDGIVTRSIVVGEGGDAARHGSPGATEDTPPRGATPPARPSAHPNGATGLDHVVVSTPAFTRTISALEAAGMELRRTRDAGSQDKPLRQGFLWAGDVLVEVAGPPDLGSDEPARLWGIVAVVPELEPLLDLPGGVIGEIRDAVQPGRRIASVPRAAGLSVPLAFMTPHQKGAQTAPAG